MKTKIKAKFKYCDVLVDAKAVRKKRFTYSYKSNLELKPGSIVKVPFRNKKISGLVLAKETKKPSFKTKEIEEIIFNGPVLDPPYFKLAEIISKYYFTSLSSIIFSMVPRYLRVIKTRKAVLKHEKKVKICKISNKNKKKKVKIRKFLLFDPEEKNTLRIYIKSIKKNLNFGKKVLFLVPDTKLPIVKKIQKEFSKKTILLTPEMSEIEHFKNWLKIKCNQYDIIIGSHLALFSHIHNLGLIIAHQEEDKFYKNEQKPRYHAVKVAQDLADLRHATIILQSKVPRIETYFHCKKNKKTRILRSTPMKTKETGKHENSFPLRSNHKIIDLRKEKSLISFSLEQEIAKTLSRQGKVLIFHNRKGYARFFICSDCGHSNYLLAKEKPLTLCANCNSVNVKNASFGTKRIEEDLQKTFPKAKIVRIEKDTKYQIQNTKYDVIIATSYIFNLDPPKFDLAAVILAELGLNFPDFHSSERVFKNLYLLSGLGKKVVFQTYSPNNKTISLALKRNFDSFYKKETKSRQKDGFPPFKQAVRLILEGKRGKQIKSEISYVAGELKSLSATFPQSYEILGPTQITKRKKGGKFRSSLLLLGNNPYPALSLVPNNFKIDIDPVDLL
jgi:primosomal protein N' (replication factor Y)